MARKILNWRQFGATGTALASGAKVDIAGAVVTVDFLSEFADASHKTDSAPQFVLDGEDFDPRSALKLYGVGIEGGVDNTQTATFSFDTTNDARVTDVAFRINDIEIGAGYQPNSDVVAIRAYDANSDEVPVNLTSANGQVMGGNTVSASVNSPLSRDRIASVLVNISGPVARIELDYDNGTLTDRAIWLSNIHFTTPEGQGATADGASRGHVLVAAANQLNGYSIVHASPQNPGGFVEFKDIRGTVTGTLSFKNLEKVIPCFTPGTVIATPRGERPVEDLKVGDRIVTRDNGLQEICWIGRRNLSETDLAQAPHLKPVMIRAGALGHGLPERDMLVSPQHRFLINNNHTKFYFEENEVLAAAKHLTGIDGVDVVRSGGANYIHLMCSQHEMILSNGTWTESFQPGERVLDGMGAEQRGEIFGLFPKLREPDGQKAYQSARRSLSRDEAGMLAK